MDATDLDPAVDYIFTIGHSNTPIDVLLANLRAYGIEALVDVRSQPVSRFAPHFNRRALEATLGLGGVRYVFAGDELGGRPADHTLYDDEGHVRYDALSSLATFGDGIDALHALARDSRTAVMCSEEDPVRCHRHLLIARVLRRDGADPTHIIHIRRDASAQTDADCDAQAELLPTTWRSPEPIVARERRTASQCRPA